MLLIIDTESTPASINNALSYLCPEKRKKIDLASARKKDISKYINYLEKCPLDSLVAGTATIGRKWIGGLSVDDQYIEMKKVLKRLDNYKDSKYIGFFEQAQNGNIHCHLLIYNMYKSSWDETVKCLGKHNLNKKSFKKVARLRTNEKGIGYWEYISKEHDESYHRWRFITNIKPTELKNDQYPEDKDVLEMKNYLKLRLMEQRLKMNMD